MLNVSMLVLLVPLLAQLQGVLFKRYQETGTPGAHSVLGDPGAQQHGSPGYS